MQTIIVTGGSEGLGKSIAKQLAGSYDVYILARKEDDLKSVSKELGVKYKVCDVSDWPQVKEAVDEIASESGEIYGLVNNAGLWIQGELADNDPQRIAPVIEVNVLGVIYMAKATLLHMKKSGTGTIVNISSQAGLYPKAERTVYNASKWGVTGFSRSLEMEVAKYGIRVSAIYPGKINTDMFTKLGIDKSMDDAIEPDEIARAVDFIFKTDPKTVIPDLSIKSIEY